MSIFVILKTDNTFWYVSETQARIIDTVFIVQKEELLSAHNLKQNILLGFLTNIFRETFKSNLESVVNFILHTF